MGVPSDLTVANRDEAADILNARGAHLRKWTCLESKEIDGIKLGTLAAILQGKSVDDNDAVVSFMGDGAIVAEAGKGGPWIFEVPEVLVSGIAGLQEDAYYEIATKWAATEELVLDRWSPDDTEHLVDTVKLAGMATGAGKGLLLWMSL
jgi:hypothetical protein